MCVRVCVCAVAESRRGCRVGAACRGSLHLSDKTNLNLGCEHTVMGKQGLPVGNQEKARLKQAKRAPAGAALLP